MESIGDAQGFSGKTSITPSGGFSVEILIGVTLSWKTELNRSISAVKDRIPRWLQHCHEMCCKKGGCCGRRACMITLRRCNFRTDGLAHDSIPPLGLSFWSPIGFTWKIPWWYLDQQYINRKECFSLLFLYYHVFPCLLQHFTKQCWNPQKAAARDVAEAQGGAVASSPTGRSSEVTLGWAHGSEG